MLCGLQRIKTSNSIISRSKSRIDQEAYHVPPNKYILFPITKHDCLLRALGGVPRVLTRLHTFVSGSKQCKSLKC